jgi:hypothetical protein
MDAVDDRMARATSSLARRAYYSCRSDDAPTRRANPRDTSQIHVIHPKTRVAADKTRTNAVMTHRTAATICRAPADCVVSRAERTGPYIGAAVCA